jgi:hypothetical protein
MKIKYKANIKPAAAYAEGKPRRQQPTPKIKSKANIKPTLAHAAGTPTKPQARATPPPIPPIAGVFFV